jgi:hypothetical protein
MKRPAMKASRRLDVTDPYGRRTKMSHSIQKTFASGGRIGDTKDPYLSGKGSPWSLAHKPKK